MTHSLGFVQDSMTVCSMCVYRRRERSDLLFSSMSFLTPFTAKILYSECCRWWKIIKCLCMHVNQNQRLTENILWWVRIFSLIIMCQNHIYFRYADKWTLPKHYAEHRTFVQHNIHTTSAQHFRRWPNIVEMLHQCFVFTGYVCPTITAILIFLLHVRLLLHKTILCCPG